MARIFIDGFEHGDTSMWPSTSGATVIATVGDMSGNYQLYLSQNGWLYVTFPSSYSALYGQFRFNRWNSSGNGTLFRIYDSGTALATIYLDCTNSRFQIYRGNSATLLASGTATIAQYTDYLVTFYYKPDASSGAFQIKIDGIEDINYSGNTVPGAQTTVNQVAPLGNTAGGHQHRYDDFVFDDSVWITGTRIFPLVPTGAGSTTQWSPSAGNNYACVDEVPYSDADYVYTNTNDNIDTYAMDDLPYTPDSIKAVQIQIRARKEGSSTPQNIAIIVRSGGTDYAGTDQALTTSFAGYRRLLENDPDTSSPWTEGGVNAMEAGVKARA